MREQPAPKKYEVQLGYARVSVEGDSKDDAIRRARKELSTDMPRLYDVIHLADVTQFHVAETQN